MNSLDLFMTICGWFLFFILPTVVCMSLWGWHRVRDADIAWHSFNLDCDHDNAQLLRKIRLKRVKEAGMGRTIVGHPSEITWVSPVRVCHTVVVGKCNT